MRFIRWVKKEIIWLGLMLPYYLGAIKIWSRVEVNKISQGLQKCSVVVVSVIDESLSQADVKFFLDYYRTLGFNNFILIVEKGSSIDASDYAGVSLFSFSLDVENNYESRDLVNSVLYRYCVGKWTLLTNITEYMVYPYCDTRDISELVDFLNSTRKKAISGISGIYEGGALANSDYVHKYIKTYYRAGRGVKLTGISSVIGDNDLANIFNRIAMIRWSRKYAFRECYSTLKPLHLMDGYKPSKVLTYFLNDRDLDYFNITKDSVSITKCWPEIQEKGLIHDGEWS